MLCRWGRGGEEVPPSGPSQHPGAPLGMLKAQKQEEGRS